jgi:hypothetical protein
MKRLISHGLTIGTVVACGLAGFVVSANAAGPGQAKDPGGFIQVEPNPDVRAAKATAAKGALKVLDAAQGPAVTFPASVNTAIFDWMQIDPAGLKLVGRHAGSQQWVATNSQGDVCLISVARDEATAGGTCATPDIFQASGIGLQVQTNDGAVVEAYVVPDTYVEAAAREPGLLGTSGNVLFTDPSDKVNAPLVLASRKDAVTTNRAPSGDLKLQNLPAASPLSE